jgi:hypothetical protein
VSMRPLVLTIEIDNTSNLDNEYRYAEDFVLRANGEEVCREATQSSCSEPGRRRIVGCIAPCSAHEND